MVHAHDEVVGIKYRTLVVMHHHMAAVTATDVALLPFSVMVGPLGLSQEIIVQDRVLTHLIVIPFIFTHKVTLSMMRMVIIILLPLIMMLFIVLFLLVLMPIVVLVLPALVILLVCVKVVHFGSLSLLIIQNFKFKVLLEI